jgi:hypothetical protein
MAGQIGQRPGDYKDTKIAHLSPGSSNWFNPNLLNVARRAWSAAMLF